MGRVDGTELYDGVLGNCNNRLCIKTGSNEEEWLEYLTPGLRKGILSRLYFPTYNIRRASEVKKEAWVAEAD
jgi:hypothetical protein